MARARRPSARSPSARRSPARSARPAASGGSSPTWRRGCGPTSPPASTGTTTAACAPRSPSWCRRTPASRTSSRSATPSSTAAATSASTDGSRPRPGRGRFSVLDVAPTALGPDEWYVSTRRGKQFNSMVLAATDPLTGAGRDAVYIDEHDAGVLGVADGDPITLRSPAGRFDGAGQARAAAGADAAGALAGGQRAARRRRRPPRTAEPGARLQRRRHPRGRR